MEIGLRAKEPLSKSAKQQGCFALLCAGTLLVGWRPLVDDFAQALRDDDYTYVLLILPISAALILLDWRSLRTKLAFNVRTGSILLLIAILIASAGLASEASLSTDEQLSIRMFALVLSWSGAFVLCFGSWAWRAALFPLCFLIGLVPIPQVGLSRIISWLQLGSAWSAHVLFAVFGVPVVQDGILLTIPGLTLQVAEQCSSIRSSSMLLVTTIVLAQLFLRSPWRKAVTICLAVPLSIAKNGLRIFTIGVLGTRVDPAYLTGRLHHEGGVVFFAIALIVTFAMLWLLRRGENESSPSTLKAVRGATVAD
jgi:exosortase